MELMKSGNPADVRQEHSQLIEKIYSEDDSTPSLPAVVPDEEEASHEVEVVDYGSYATESAEDKFQYAEEIQEEENLSLQDKELELIKKSLEKFGGRRKAAAKELGISERTLYRKIKQYNL
jgi:transcriptional regulator with PAS, ATPase and Fis domain